MLKKQQQTIPYTRQHEDEWQNEMNDIGTQEDITYKNVTPLTVKKEWVPVVYCVYLFRPCREN